MIMLLVCFVAYVASRSHGYLQEERIPKNELRPLATLLFAVNPLLRSAAPGVYRATGLSQANRAKTHLQLSLDSESSLDNRSNMVSESRGKGINALPPLESAAAYEAKVEEAKQKDKIVVIKFVAAWCKMCRAMNPKIYRIAERFPGVEFYDLDFDKNKQLVKSLRIRALPHVQIIGGSSGGVKEFTCSRGEVSKLLETIESYGGVQKSPEFEKNSPTLPSAWAPYVTNVEEVGSGNFGKVYSMDLTCPNSMPTKVAMKGLHRDTANKRLMENEVFAIRDLSDFLLSDNLTQKLGIDDDYSAYCEPLLAEPKVQNGELYLPMPFCNQGEFKAIYNNETKRNTFGGYAGMYALLLHIAKGVKVLHGAGWVHNDLHGGNAMITCSTDEVPGSCYASIIDLGLSSKIDTISGGARGYRYGISPEVVALKTQTAYPNPKSDVWQLGMLLWELRLGFETLPTNLEGSDLDAILKLIPTLDFKNASFPELEGETAIRNLLRGMLTNNATERWDIDTVIAELEKVALPEMLGPHESAWLNAGCLIDGRIPIGSVVEVVGLKSAKELNGYSGEIVQYHTARRAYEVRFNDGNVTLLPAQKVRLIE